MSSIHPVGSTHGINTTRNIFLQKVKESKIKEISFAKIRAFYIFNASKKKDRYVENIHPQLDDSGDSQV